MKKQLIKEYVSHDVSFDHVSTDYHYARISSVGSWYEVEHRYTSMPCPKVYKYSDYRPALLDFMFHVNFLLSR